MTLQAEAAAGMYKKPIEVLAKQIHYTPLSQERALVIAAWKRGNMLPDAVIAIGRLPTEIRHIGTRRRFALGRRARVSGLRARRFDPEDSSLSFVSDRNRYHQGKKSRNIVVWGRK